MEETMRMARVKVCPLHPLRMVPQILLPTLSLAVRCLTVQKSRPRQARGRIVKALITLNP